MGVDTGGAGDQGMMFGYATSESPELMPLPITLAHRLTRRLAQARKDGEIDWLRPDGKTQVTVEYEDDTPVRVQAVVVSTQHHDDIENGEIRDKVRRLIIEPVLPQDLYDPELTEIHINPTGRFVTGGPQGDAGLTGRKIIVDTYGGMGRHGGGAFSGKDATKVDRSASYAARWIAKNVVAAELAKTCEVQLAYAIGVADPVSVLVDTRGSGTVPDGQLEAAVRQVFDLTPLAIIKSLGLRRPIFKRTAAYGHFGREPDSDGGFSWERCDKVEDLKSAIG
jgi:S-adenosylmethionine synthetase